MAVKLGDTNLGNGNYVKPEELYQEGAVFTMTKAVYRVGGGFEGKGDSVRFTIVLNGEDEEKEFDLSANAARISFAEYFDKPGAEEIENLQFKKIRTNKGNPAWGFEDAGGDE